jgi:hypothetical protein
MMFPTVHLNGASKKDLIEQYENAMDAVQKACDTVRQSYPNGRDYYPQGSDAINRAMDEHASRLNRLAGVRRELEDVLSHILEAK